MNETEYNSRMYEEYEEYEDRYGQAEKERAATREEEVRPPSQLPPRFLPLSPVGPWSNTAPNSVPSTSSLLPVT